MFIHTPDPSPTYPHPGLAGCGLSSRGAQDPFLSSQQSPGTVVLQMWSPVSSTTWDLMREANAQVQSQSC